MYVLGPVVKARNDESLSEDDALILQRYYNQVLLDWQFVYVE